MADNFLEKQMEQYRGSHNTPNKARASLDTLLSAVGGTQKSDLAEKDNGYVVRPEQLEAIVRACERLGDGFSYEISAQDTSIHFSLNDSTSTSGSLAPTEDALSTSFALGRIALASELKASEMHLHAETFLRSGGRSLVVTIWK